MLLRLHHHHLEHAVLVRSPDVDASPPKIELVTISGSTRISIGCAPSKAGRLGDSNKSHLSSRPFASNTHVLPPLETCRNMKTTQALTLFYTFAFGVLSNPTANIEARASSVVPKTQVISNKSNLIFYHGRWDDVPSSWWYFVLSYSLRGHDIKSTSGQARVSNSHFQTFPKVSSSTSDLLPLQLRQSQSQRVSARSGSG
jgi:hypothetical protein